MSGDSGNRDGQPLSTAILRAILSSKRSPNNPEPL